MFNNQKSRAIVFLALLLAVFAIIIVQITQASAHIELAGIAQPNLVNMDLLTKKEEVTANNITLRLIGSHQEGDNYQVDVCYTLPDERDWLLADRGTEVFLNVNGKFVYPVEEGTIDWIFATDGTKSERCEYLLFPVVMDKNAVAKLTITQLSVSPPEGLDCPFIQKRLDEMKSGITVECYVDKGNSGGGSGINIVAKPAKMTDLDARDLAHQIIIDARPGPWEFEIYNPGH